MQKRFKVEVRTAYDRPMTAKSAHQTFSALDNLSALVMVRLERVCVCVCASVYVCVCLSFCLLNNSSR